MYSAFVWFTLVWFTYIWLYFLLLDQWENKETVKSHFFIFFFISAHITEHLDIIMEIFSAVRTRKVDLENFSAICAWAEHLALRPGTCWRHYAESHCTAPPAEPHSNPPPPPHVLTAALRPPHPPIPLFVHCSHHHFMSFHAMFCPSFFIASYIALVCEVGLNCVREKTLTQMIEVAVCTIWCYSLLRIAMFVYTMAAKDCLLCLALFRKIVMPFWVRLSDDI